MVFKTIAGELEVISSIWNDDQPYNENLLETLNKDNEFRGHYKNKIVQNWEVFNPLQVY